MNQVFDDIQLDFEGVAERAYHALGYSLPQLKSQVSPEDADRIIEDLKEYYYEVIQVVEKRYEEVKVILETYYRQLIALRREEIDMRHLSEDDFEEEATTFAQIADKHNAKLQRLRENFESFSKLIDGEFDNQIIQVNKLSGMLNSSSLGDDPFTDSYQNQDSGLLL